MQLCKECGEPAVKSFIIRTGGGPQTHLCYAHAAEASLLDLPLETITAIADEIEYPVNAIAFVLEALFRADSLETEQDVSTAVIKSARERFPRCAREVLSTWHISARSDIGNIAFALKDRQLIHGAGSISRDDFDRAFTLGEVLDAP